MPGRQYSYQYETSPRKIKPEYSKPKRNTTQYNKTKVKTKAKPKATKPEKKVIKNSVKKQEDVKAKNLLIAKTKIAVFFKCALLFLIVFFMILTSKQSNSFFIASLTALLPSLITSSISPNILSRNVFILYI